MPTYFRMRVIRAIYYIFIGGIVMVRWLIIGFLLVCLILFMLEVGQAMDYDPEWDDAEWGRKEKDIQENEQEIEE